MKPVIFTAAALSLLAAGPAFAQGAQRPPAEITVINARSVPLTVFEIASTGAQPRLVAKIARPLAPGASVKLKMNRPTGCSYFVLARFQDDSESEDDSMNLCGERQIRLTE
jgi:hypothetical protein